jgi:hypothetical protein
MQLLTDILGWQGWSGIVALATLAAALATFFTANAARRAANTAESQLRDERTWKMRERVFYHSPYRNDKLNDSIRYLESKYKYKHEKVDTYDEKANEEEILNIEIAANLFGQMASEYQNDLIDKALGKKVLKNNFVSFCRYFKPWLEKREELYSDTLALYKEWSCDSKKIQPCAPMGCEMIKARCSKYS